MGGGNTNTNTDAGGSVTFAPMTTGNSAIHVGGNVGNADINQQTQATSTGMSLGLNANIGMPGLQNLRAWNQWTAQDAHSHVE